MVEAKDLGELVVWAPRGTASRARDDVSPAERHRRQATVADPDPARRDHRAVRRARRCRPCHLAGHPASIMGTIEDGGERFVLSFVVVSVLAALGEG